MSKDLEALVQYFQQANTDYAYMLTGDWGSGKTYFWKNSVVPALEPSTPGDDKWRVIYVPLYAIKTPEEIRRAVVAQLHPVIATGGQWLGLLAPTVLDYLPTAGVTRKGLTKVGEWFRGWKATEQVATGGTMDRILMALRRGKGLVICFDDLERSAMPADEVLGHINQFVEHLGAKVVILCNEDEILGLPVAEKYRKAKEKVVRISRAYTCDVEKVALAMIEQFRHNKNFHRALTSNRELIASIIRRADIRNLRHVKYALLVLESAHDVLAKLVPGDTIWIRRAINTLLPVTLELQEGRISKKEATQVLTQGGTAILWADKGKDDDKPSPLAGFGERHGFGLLGGDLWASTALAALIDTGHLDSAKMKEEIDREGSEQTPGKDAARALRNGWFRLPDEELPLTVETALAGVRNGEIADWMQLYTCASVFDWIVATGVVPIKPDDVAAAFAMGIDRIMKDGTFEVIEPREADHRFMFRENERDIARGVREELVAANLQLVKVAHKAAVQKAFRDLGEEGHEFSDMMSEIEHLGFGNRPIVDLLTPKEFVDGLLASPNGAKSYVRRGIDRRYKEWYRLPALMEDMPWLVEAQKLLEQAAADTPADRPLCKLLLRELAESLGAATKSLLVVASEQGKGEASGLDGLSA